jgi:2-methylcitrate dehydratase PrpD
VKVNTAAIANFVAETGYDRIPQEALTSAKWFILDCLGVSLAGSQEPASRIISDYVKDLGGKPEATVIMMGFKTSSPQAALVNGTMAHALDYDDSHPNFQHATASTLPAVLALAERERISGQAVLEAYILGCDVGSKIGTQIEAKLAELGWHPCGILGSLAASVAASKILKLGKEQIRRALGIAASQAAGLGRNIGTDTKPFHAGNAAKNGVQAAMLAMKGFSADESILDGPKSFPALFARRESDLANLSTQLGSPFSIVSPGIRIKPYPTGGPSHKSISAILDLMEKHGFHAQDVVEIECKVSPQLVRHFQRYSHPRNASQGRFSMHYAVAAALLDGEVTLKQFTDEKVLAPEAQDLMARVKLVELETEVEEGLSLTDPPQIVTVKLRNGKGYSHQVPFPKGEAQNPMSPEEIRLKFGDCASLVLSPADIDRAAELVLNLERLPNIAGLIDLVSKGKTLSEVAER